MVTPETMIISIIAAVFGSTGFWAVVSKIIEGKQKNRSAEAMMLRGLGHNEIIRQGTEFIERGYITTDEYKELNDYLYEPYEKLGGNGTAKKVMDEVRKLPIRADL